MCVLRMGSFGQQLIMMAIMERISIHNRIHDRRENYYFVVVITINIVNLDGTR